MRLSDILYLLFTQCSAGRETIFERVVLNAARKALKNARRSPVFVCEPPLACRRSSPKNLSYEVVRLFDGYRDERIDDAGRCSRTSRCRSSRVIRSEVRDH